MNKRVYLLLIVAIIVTNSCKEDELVDLNYPTTYQPLTRESDFNNILDQLEKTELVNYTAIDTFGFPVFITDIYDSLENKEWSYKTTLEALTASTKKAVIEYGYFINTADSASIDVLIVTTSKGINFSQFLESYSDSLPNVWKVVTQNQKVDGLEVIGSNLNFLFSPNGAIAIDGHWYSDVYIPAIDKYSEEEAKALILDKTLTDGNSSLTIDLATNWQNSKKIILPIKSSYKIEMRVCWVLHTDNWEIFIDSQTGEIHSSIDIGNY
ncbi:MAG: hypothetical protein PF541_09750 [Prolixibacteraceae bacterium]|jgi:Zn-dependent metalloprotease|nr:hypothetical protein [Prolixibacteraceae bacterium]